MKHSKLYPCPQCGAPSEVKVVGEVLVEGVYVQPALYKAAPEMLKALEKTLPLLKAYENGPWEEARNAVISVLKKIRGDETA